jgi:hypothetical protein
LAPPLLRPQLPVIDPALCPLPDISDSDLSDGPTIAKARGCAPAAKVGGSRQKVKGKQCATLVESSRRAKEKSGTRKRKHVSDDENDGEEIAKRGRPKGAGNYAADEVSALLDLIEEELPLGQRGWQSIFKSFTRWARRNGKKERALKLLETKFKQVHLYPSYVIMQC